MLLIQLLSFLRKHVSSNFFSVNKIAHTDYWEGGLNCLVDPAKAIPQLVVGVPDRLLVAGVGLEFGI